MSPLAGPLFAAALLLMAAGAIKLARPGTTRIAMRTAGLPSTPSAARLVGIGEVGIGLYALGFAGPFGALLVAAAYLGFAGFAERVRRVGRGDTPCGCFGTTSAPVETLHVVVNLVVAAISLAAVARPSAPVGRVVSATPLGGTVFVAFTVMLAWLTAVALTALPELADAARPRRPMAR